MGAVQAGIIPQSCDKCQRDPSLKCLWGCDKPSQTVVEVIPDDEGNAIEYYSCPILYITPKSTAFHTKRGLLKQGLVAPKEFGKEEATYINANVYFNNWLNFYEGKKNGR